jgi:nitrile hydratase accessory protein
MKRSSKVADILDTQGAAAPPRRNGELSFSAPWESRLFGLTMLLHRAGVFEWDDFRALLIEEIRAWEAHHPDGHDWSYYERWHIALEKLLMTKGVCDSKQLEEKTASLAARPHGHDHRKSIVDRR